MKKNKKRNLYRTSTSMDAEYSKVIKIAIGVILILALTYFVTALATGEIQFGKEEEEIEEVSIQYEEIIAGQVLNRSNEEYYVMLFDFTDTFASYYLSLKDAYLETENALPFYIVDLEKHINQEIVAENDESDQTNVDNIHDLKVFNPTIIKIKNHKVVESIIGKENVLNFLESDE